MNGSTSQAIFEAAQTRWLSVDEIVTVLSSAHDRLCRGMPTAEPILEQEAAPPSSPPTSGTVLLYDRVAVRNYKVDGHEWVRKRSNPTKIREDHVKLRYDGIHRISGTYVHSDEIDTLHRRVYRLIKAAEEKTVIAYGGPIKQEFVLVQYLDTEHAANISSMTKNKNTKSKPRSSRRITNKSKRSRSRGCSSNRSISSSIISSSSYSSSNSDKEYHPTGAVAAAASANASFSASLGAQAHHYQSPTDIPKRQRTSSSTSSYHAYANAVDKSLAWNPPLTSSVLTNDFGRIFPKSSFHGESGHRNDDALDDIHFDDLWDMIESDAALSRGLEALIDPRVGKVVDQARRQEQQQQQQRRSSNSSALHVKHQEGEKNVTKESSCASQQDATAPATNHKQQYYSYPKELYQHGYYDNNDTEPARPPHPQQRPIVDTCGEEIEQFQV
mmetsp:Transcript_2183/g.4905  ORF Transcript_2183/g.4905 Transcript_2183/m.4905 type:complete len:442 (+) Transcript_2183:87-1412(+)